MPNGTEDPETKNKELRFVLDDALVPVTWVRVTCTRDSRNKRENYTINLYSGSSDDPRLPLDSISQFLIISFKTVALTNWRIPANESSKKE